MIVFTAICFVMWALWPGWHYAHDLADGVGTIPSKASENVIMACIMMSFILSLVAALWQHTAAVAVASMIESIGQGIATTSIGTIAMTLSWTASVLFFLLAGHIYIPKAARKRYDILVDG